MEKESEKITIMVYLKAGGVVREYDVNTSAQAREHVGKSIETGCRYVERDKLTHVPPHGIDKVVAQGPGITTKYPDRTRGT